LYPEDSTEPDYINCRTFDRIPRSFDLFSLPEGSRDVAERNLPFAVNLYLGIGEAF
jgi:hypothetical protein